MKEERRNVAIVTRQWVVRDDRQIERKREADRDRERERKSSFLDTKAKH